RSAEEFRLSDPPGELGTHRWSPACGILPHSGKTRGRGRQARGRSPGPGAVACPLPRSAIRSAPIPPRGTLPPSGQHGPGREGEPMDTTSLPTGTVTFLFTDIEGSTRLWEHHPDAIRL